MRKELEQETICTMAPVIERLNTEGDVSHTEMPRGFRHGDGWFDIPWRLSGGLGTLG